MSEVKLHFLDNRSKNGYVTFGVPWKRGEINKNTEFSAYNSSEKIPAKGRQFSKDFTKLCRVIHIFLFIIRHWLTHI